MGGEFMTCVVQASCWDGKLNTIALFSSRRHLQYIQEAMLHNQITVIEHYSITDNHKWLDIKIRVFRVIGVGDGGHCAPQNCADVRIRAKYGQIRAKILQNSVKFWVNSGKLGQIRAEMEANSVVFFFFLLVNYFCRISIGSHVPLTNTKIYNWLGRGEKGAWVPPSPLPLSEVLLAGFGQNGPKMCVPPPPPQWIDPVRLWLEFIHCFKTFI